MPAALGPPFALAILFPEGGYQPFAFSTLWPLLLIGAALVVAAIWFRPAAPKPPGHTMIVIGVVLYLAGCLAAFAIHTPVGANAARLGELVAGPLAALLLVPRRAWLLLALAAIPLTYVQVHDAITDLSHGSQASSAAYYRPLIAFLRRQPGVWRVEVPFTAGHWESYRLAPEFPLARGWERQLDIEDNPLFYDGRLTADSYAAWLHRLAVRYVAVADAPADYSARRELALIRGGLPYLHVVARMRHWTVYAVADPTPIATGAGRLVSLRANTLTLALTHPGSVLVRVRWSPYWQLSGTRGCVAPAGSFTRVQARGRGRAQLRMSFSPGRVGSRSARCTG